MYKTTIEPVIFPTDENKKLYILGNIEFWYNGLTQGLYLKNTGESLYTIIETYFGNNRIGALPYKTEEWSGKPEQDIFLGFSGISQCNNKCIWQDLTFWPQDASYVQYFCNVNLMCVDGMTSRFQMAWGEAPLLMKEKLKAPPPIQIQDQHLCERFAWQSLLSELQETIDKFK